MNIYGSLVLLCAAAGSLIAQPVSSYNYAVKGDEKTVDITNVHYELAASFVLRTVTTSKEIIGDIGIAATTTVDAWKLGVDLKESPLYSVRVEGTDSHTIEQELFVISRGLEEVKWWSIYRIATGAHLFDTYVPLVELSIGRENVAIRYAGLEVPEDDNKDARLKDPHVVAVLSYASEANVIREALITCDDPKQAALLRSFADEARSLVQSAQGLRLTFSQEFPAPPAPLSITIPIAHDDLDLAHAQLPPRLHITAWKR
jgi:hypothetical protein